MIIVITILLVVVCGLSKWLLGNVIPCLAPPREKTPGVILQSVLSAGFVLAWVVLIMNGQANYTDAVREAPTDRTWWLVVLVAPLLETLLFQTLIINLIDVAPERQRLTRGQKWVVLTMFFTIIHVVVLGPNVGIAVGLCGGVVWSTLYVMYLPSHPRAILASASSHICYNAAICTLSYI